MSTVWPGVSAPPGGSTRLARTLFRLTIAWNLMEGVVAVSCGLVASSVALIGFGLDSFIEVMAAGVLVWRLNLPPDDRAAEQREHTAHQVVGATFLALAVYIVVQAVHALTRGNEPGASPVGLTLALLSLPVMPFLGVLKRHNALPLGSSALVAESTETLICCYLSFTLFIGLAANLWMGGGGRTSPPHWSWCRGCLKKRPKQAQ